MLKIITPLAFILLCGYTAHAKEFRGGTPPTADFSYYIEFVGVGADVSFDNISSDADTYYWDFGDGSTSTDVSPFHHYDLPGLYYVCLTAYNAYGSDTYCDTLNTYYAPSAEFSSSGDPTVSFTDLSTNFPTVWFWEFGDGDTSTMENPVHTYLLNGTYTVCLSVNNPGGTNSICHDVTISSYVTTVADFSYSGSPDVVFTDLSSDAPFAWSWDFGDGGTSTLQNPEHIYAANGTYSVCLTATNAGGTNTYCEDVVISNVVYAPEADYAYSAALLAVTFTDMSTNSPVSWSWDFADATTSSEENPVHTFPSEGTFYVCLTASNAAGSSDACKNIFLQTGIDDKNPGTFLLYPNPAENSALIEFNSAFPNPVIDLFDISGRAIAVPVIKISDDDYQIDLSNVPAGSYLLRIKNAQFISERTLIIEH